MRFLAIVSSAVVDTEKAKLTSDTTDDRHGDGAKQLRVSLSSDNIYILCKLLTLM